MTSARRASRPGDPAAAASSGSGCAAAGPCGRSFLGVRGRRAGSAAGRRLNGPEVDGLLPVGGVRTHGDLLGLGVVTG